MNRYILTAALCALLALIFNLAADAAQAAVQVENAGKNAGDMLRSWSVPLFGGGAGIMGVFYLFSRKVGPAIVFFAMAMLVGGFVFAPDQLGAVSKDLWQTILGA